MTNTDQQQAAKYRQGDVLLVAVDTIPDDATVIPRKTNGVVLADGKASGHAHRIPSFAASLHQTADGARYLRAVEPVVLVHEEHSVVALPAGDYLVNIHAEYQPGELPRQVED